MNYSDFVSHIVTEFNGSHENYKNSDYIYLDDKGRKIRISSHEAMCPRSKGGTVGEIVINFNGDIDSPQTTVRFPEANDAEEFADLTDLDIDLEWDDWEEGFVFNDFSEIKDLAIAYLTAVIPTSKYSR